MSSSWKDIRNRKLSDKQKQNVDEWVKKEIEMSEEQKPEKEKTISEILQETPPEMKDYWLTIFLLLNKSERFHKFVEDNFEIKKNVDHKSQMIDVVVEEKEPKPGKLLVPTKDLFKLHGILAQGGCQNPAATLQKIIQVLGGEEPSILTANEKDLKEEIDKQKKQHELKKDLD